MHRHHAYQKPASTSPFKHVKPWPHPTATPPAVWLARQARAMDIEFAFFKRKHPPPLKVFALGDTIFALNDANKTVGFRIVRLIR